MIMKTEFGLFSYLAQAVQMSFFFALIIHISSSVRQKIWFKESGNLSVKFNSFRSSFIINLLISSAANENNGNGRVIRSDLLDHYNIH